MVTRELTKGITRDITRGIIQPFNYFIFTVKTDNAGTSLSDQFTVPTVSAGTYDCTVDWGDGSDDDTITTWNDSAWTHTYSSAGTYTIKITGILQGWSFNNAGDESKLIGITQVGMFDHGNEDGAFYGCDNLTSIAATDKPLIKSGSTSVVGFFRGSGLTSLSWSLYSFATITDATNFLEGTTITTANYDSLLNLLDGQSLQTGVNIHFGGATYSIGDAATSHYNLINDDSWTITDGGAEIDNLVLWLDAEDVSTVTESSSFVSQWDDKSGLGNDLTQATGTDQPLYTSSEYLRFDGVDDELLKSTTSFRYDEYTVFAVIRNETTDTNSNVAYFSTPGGPNPDVWTRARSNGTLSTSASSDIPSIFSTSAIGSLSTDYVVTNYSGSTSNNQYIRVNGSQTTGSLLDSAIQKASTEIALGRQKSGRSFGGRIYEVLVYSDNLSSDEVTSIETYLNNKWSVY